MKSGKISSILIALFFCVLMPISSAAYTDDFYATDTKWNNLTNLNSLERGGNLDVHTKIVNTSGTPQMVNLIAGYYDDDGRFVECQMYEIEVPEGEQTVDHSFEWDDVLLSANSEAKLFVFAENIRPLCDAVSLKYENQFDGFLGKKIYTCDFESDIDSAFKNYTIEKVGGSDALKIEGASTIAVTGSILENSENVAILAEYDTDGRLVRVDLGEYTYNKSTQINNTVTRSLDNCNAAYTYKFFVWDSLEGLRPLKNASVLAPATPEE